MNAAEIKKGDVVQLKSGGPKMTVSDTGSWATTPDGAECVWFDKDGKQQSKVFDRAVLVHAD